MSANSLKNNISRYMVLIMAMSGIILVWFPNLATRIIFNTLFLITIGIWHYDVKLRGNNSDSILPKWLLSEWAFWIVMTIMVVLSIYSFVSF